MKTFGLKGGDNLIEDPNKPNGTAAKILDEKFEIGEFLQKQYRPEERKKLLVNFIETLFDVVKDGKTLLSVLKWTLENKQ